jgi:hypothetical protein
VIGTTKAEVRGERVPKRTGAEATMANSYLLDTLRGTAARTGLQIATLVGDLSRSLDILSADIEHEEARAGVRDVSNPTYPGLARSLRKRRENIGATIAMLENLRAPKASALDTKEREVA